MESSCATGRVASTLDSQEVRQAYERLRREHEANLRTLAALRAAPGESGADLLRQLEVRNAWNGWILAELRAAHPDLA